MIVTVFSLVRVCRWRLIEQVRRLVLGLLWLGDASDSIANTLNLNQTFSVKLR